MSVRGGTAVMARRTEPPDSLDFFPTPPWATRALVESVFDRLGISIEHSNVWEPACGQGHMSKVLKEYCHNVLESDVHDYGIGAAVGSFVGQGLDVMASPARLDWVITNPPFNLAEEFVERAVCEAKANCALLLRTAWLEGAERWRNIFGRIPPTHVAQFVERVPMTRGRWDPQASSATAYSWFIWQRPRPHDGTQLMWIPPGMSVRLSSRDDAKNFAMQEPL